MAQREYSPAERELIDNFRQFLEGHPEVARDDPGAVHEYAAHNHDPATAPADHAALHALLLPVWEQYRTDQSIL